MIISHIFFALLLLLDLVKLFVPQVLDITMKFATAAYIISQLSHLASVANGAGLRVPVKKPADASEASQTSNELSLDDTHFNLNDYDPEVYSELFHPLYKTFHNLTLAEQDAILDERDRNVKGYHRGLMVEHDHSFKESGCNINVENEPCMSFDDFMLSQVSNGHRYRRIIFDIWLIVNFH